VATGDYLVIDSKGLQRHLRAFNADLAKRTRRTMSTHSRGARDEIRRDWKRGPSKGGHSFRAVGSGTRGLIPTLTLNRAYRPYIGWLVFGGKRARDRQARRVPDGGLWFYPGIKRARPRVVAAVKRDLEDAIRQAS
jgi:hypothetical protein